MIPDRDIWRAANLLIREHKAEADIVAARRADECWNAAIVTGNLSGFGSSGQSLSYRPRPWGSRISAARRPRACGRLTNKLLLNPWMGHEPV